MKKPTNLKQRKADNIMKPLEGVKLTPFQVVENRGWGTARDLKNRSNITFDWRLQWGDTDSNHQYRQQQLVEIQMGKEKGVFSRQELERYLRHV